MKVMYFYAGKLSDSSFVSYTWSIFTRKRTYAGITDNQ